MKRVVKHWGLALLVAAASSYCWATRPGSAVPTLAEVQRAYAAAHPARAQDCPNGTRYFSLAVPQNIVGCLTGDELTLRYGRAVLTMELEQDENAANLYHYVGRQGKREVAYLLMEPYDGDIDSPAFGITLRDRSMKAQFPGIGERYLCNMADTSFQRAIRRILQPGSAEVGYYSAAALNDKGYALQQLGYQAEAQLFFNEVLRRYPTRAVAYLNRGDAQWAQHRPVAAQADYRRYLALLRTQHKDTTRVPAYVRLALALPAGATR